MNNESDKPSGSRAIRFAATVILLRAPYDVFLLRRSAHSAFAADAYVFPGGVLDDDDLTIGAGDSFAGASNLQRTFRASVPAALPADVPPATQAQAAGLVVAAARELFEEAGILLARDANGVIAQAHASDRAALREGSVSFAELLRGRALRIHAGDFALFSHWITPPTEPRRYDTHFFIAVAPAEQIARADAEETHDGVWISPNDALARNAAGTLHLVYPTIKHLERLCAFGTVDEALAFGRSKPIQTIMPGCAPSEGFVMPASLENAW